MDWVADLYHAIAIANGGLYLDKLQAYRASFVLPPRSAADSLSKSGLNKLEESNMVEGGGFRRSIYSKASRHRSTSTPELSQLNQDFHPR